MTPLERVMVVSYRLSIVTVGLSVTVNYSAAICYRMSPTLKSIGVGHFGPKFGVFPLE